LGGDEKHHGEIIRRTPFRQERSVHNEGRGQAESEHDRSVQRDVQRRDEAPLGEVRSVRDRRHREAAPQHDLDRERLTSSKALRTVGGALLAWPDRSGAPVASALGVSVKPIR
jgi:hypothetical protein